MSFQAWSLHRWTRALLAAIGLWCVPHGVSAGLVAVIADAVPVSNQWVIDWTIDGNDATSSGASGGYIQDDVYFKVTTFEALLPNTSAATIRAMKAQMASTADLLVTKEGDYLRWRLDSTLLACDSELDAGSLPAEFFAALVGNSGFKVILASDMSGTGVTADLVTMELDTDDQDCP